MPIYEYSCKKCGARVEVMQKISDEPLSRHAKCGGKLEKEWSRTGFQFKGSGWYVTDYAGKKSDAPESKEPKESKAEAAESKSDSSEAKAAESKPKGSKAKKDAAATGGD
ncbi:MAG TPA: FmdB family zinc ribbon protein [Pyrinomonadaceae bacterium]|jgi:putative FmdB family regulatory protein|nr:FmdB family zinc ribbon protein [Pyrinomonadaceae bacterium]